MTSFRKVKNEKLDIEIRQLFQIDELIVGEISFGGIIPIMFVRFSDLEALTKTWKDFNSYVAAEYMTLIKDEYSKWNFYVFYLSSEYVGKKLKYEIENNKFSSRKIVIEGNNLITETEINLLISEHITNDNLQVGIVNPKSSNLKKNITISKILDKINLSKKNDDDLQNALDLIEKTYTDEI